MGVVAAVLLFAAGLGAQPHETWTKLHRPLHLPVVAAGAACPVSGGKVMHAWGGQARNGRGPAFLQGVGSARLGVIDISHSMADRQGWRGQKTPWAVRKNYRGPILIRGQRVDADGQIRFAIGSGQHLREIRWPAGQSVVSKAYAYRFWANATLFRAAGCYAFQADGTSFSNVVVMRVTG